VTNAVKELKFIYHILNSYHVLLLRTRKVVGCCECGNESLCSVKCGELLGKLRTYKLLRKDPALGVGWLVSYVIFLHVLFYIGYS
jgi:hypothetical protein